MWRIQDFSQDQNSVRKINAHALQFSNYKKHNYKQFMGNMGSSNFVCHNFLQDHKILYFFWWTMIQSKQSCGLFRHDIIYGYIKTESWFEIVHVMVLKCMKWTISKELADHNLSTERTLGSIGMSMKKISRIIFGDSKYK